MNALERAGHRPLPLPATIVDRGIVRNRNVYEGYQRGTGLEFGHLRQPIDAHPLFQEAMELTRGRTVVSTDRLRNLFLICALFLDTLPSKDIIEFGSYKGGSAFFFAHLLGVLHPGAKLWAFDTFDGMPQTDKAVDFHSAGDFADVSLAEIREVAMSRGLKNIEFIQGKVEDTFPSGVPPSNAFGMAHIDLDIYHAIKHCQKHVIPFMAPGGYIVFDDATASSCIGATQAVEEFIQAGNHSEQIYPHFVFRAGLR